MQVPLDVIANEWRCSKDGLKHLQTVANHCQVYDKIFNEVFTPCGYMGVSYEGNTDVLKGNILYPRQVQQPPVVTLPIVMSANNQEQFDGFYTLILTNIDGHLQDNTKEVLHWMM